MTRFIFTLGISALSLCSLAEAASPEARLPEKHLIFLENYCFSCHDAATNKGEVNLEDLPFQIETIEQTETWQKVLSALNSGEMPPEKKKQPKGRAFQRIKYNRRFVNVVVGLGKKRSPNSNQA